ncbi:MAG: hypothetical protein R3277_13640 [Brumimicrobium sp.]|nr:hypothetical protein [Brumimicrobium sp.]
MCFMTLAIGVNGQFQRWDPNLPDGLSMANMLGKSFLLNEEYYFLIQNKDLKPELLKLRNDSLIRVADLPVDYPVDANGKSTYQLIENYFIARDKVYFIFDTKEGFSAVFSFNGSLFSPVLLSDKNTYDFFSVTEVFDNSGELYFSATIREDKDGFYHTELFKLDQDSLYTIPVNFTNSEYITPNEEGYAIGRFECMGKPFVYRNQLYLQYFDKQERQFILAVVDSNSVRNIINPDSKPDSDFAPESGYLANCILYKDKMFFQNNVFYGNNELYAFDGQKLERIKSPYRGGQEDAGFTGASVIWNGKLIYLWKSSWGDLSLISYDGKRSKKIETEIYDSFGPSSQDFSMIAFGDNVYFRSKTEEQTYSLIKFDGKNIIVMPDPDEFFGAESGYQGDHLIIGGTLILKYLDNNKNVVFYRME